MNPSDIDAAEAIVGLYERRASAWDGQRGRSLFERAWLDAFLAVTASRSILDLGCGSGEPIARYLLEAGCQVTGVDTSPTLIRMCRSRFPSARWIEADMRRLDLAESFGGILAWDSVFHLTPDDQRRMFPTFAAHSTSDAVLLFTTGPSAGTAIGTFEGEPLYHASLDPDEYRALLDANGFETIRFVPEDPTCGGHSVWLARKRSTRGARSGANRAAW